MLFNSYIFILLFLPLTFIGYFLFNKYQKYKLAKLYLLIASLIFYSYLTPKYLIIIVSSILVNYILNYFLLKYDNKKVRLLLFIFGLLFNIGIIFYYKYFNFFMENLVKVFKLDFNFKNIILPLGISFFTFQQLSYLIDSYRKEVPKYSLLDYSLFVCFFPQLIAGPIVLHSEIIPQFADIENKKINYLNISKGLKAFVLGLAKKVLIADVFGIVVDYVYGINLATNATNLIIAMFAYTIQIYFDFSGYCDMATGLGLLFNIEMPINFNSPYKALNISDFWKRWHITLTRFFTTYIYIPLGGNRKGKFRMYLNTLIVFLVSGLWHGASWGFIFWGFLHGIAVILNKIFKEKIEQVNPVFMWIITFLFINLTWIFFRAGSFSYGLQFIKQILSFDFGSIDPEILKAFNTPILGLIISALNLIRYNNIPLILYFSFVLYAILNMKNTNEKLKNFKPSITDAILTGFLFFICIISLSGISKFLYFNF